LPSLTVENYVRAIFHVCQTDDNHRAATGQVAIAMKVSPGTVTSMLKTLSDSGLAAYERYGGVRLTESGNALALNILRRHRLVELFLAEVLELDAAEARHHAESLAHALSDRLVERIDAYLGHPELDSAAILMSLPAPPLTSRAGQRKTLGVKERGPASDEGPPQWGSVNLVRDESQQP
jgi:DtxR family transcriptional regulator, Mn-dependent transcriptional regulator